MITCRSKIKTSDLECLKRKLDRGDLELETAILNVWFNRMLEPKSKYTKTQIANVHTVLEESKRLLQEAGKEMADLSPIQFQQARIYVMFGPGWMFLPSSSVTQPFSFYIDARTGSAKFPKRDIYKEVKELQTMAKDIGLTELPPLKHPHNCWVW